MRSFNRPVAACLATCLCVAVIITVPRLATAAGEIIHDAEHNVLAAQHGERWAKEDQEIGARLAEIREKNGGKPPNIVYILLDDLGFGEIGMPDLDVIRGYSTPRISQFAFGFCLHLCWYGIGNQHWLMRRV